MHVSLSMSMASFTVCMGVLAVLSPSMPVWR